LKRRAFALGVVATPAWAQPKSSTTQRNVQVLPERLPMPGLNRTRGLRLYLPPSYATQPERRYPVVYLHDAQNLFDDATAFAGEWGVDETLNALAQRTGFEAIVVGIDHGDALRIQEMLPWPHAQFRAAEGAAYTDFIALAVKPWIDARYRTRAGAADTAIGGASIGGSISHYALLRHPGVFGRALIFSPSYWSVPEFFEQVRREPAPASARLFIHIGADEVEQMREPAARMHALLRQQPAAVELRTVPGARHNEAAWRAAFEPAVRWLFEIG
jgi:predicted alpha/beta superfamily hydrolase